MRDRIFKIFLIFGLLILPETAKAAGPNKAHGITRYEHWYAQQENKQKSSAGNSNLAVNNKHKTKINNSEQNNMDYLKSKLSQNKKLGEEQKNELVKLFSSQHKQGVSFLDRQFRDSVTFFEKTANDPNLTFEEKKEAIRIYLHDKFRERNEYFKTHHAQVKSKLKQLHSQAKKEQSAKPKNE